MLVDCELIRLLFNIVSVYAGPKTKLGNQLPVLIKRGHCIIGQPATALFPIGVKGFFHINLVVIPPLFHIMLNSLLLIYHRFEGYLQNIGVHLPFILNKSMISLF